MPCKKDEADRQQENKVEQTENVGNEEKKTEGKDAGQVYYLPPLPISNQRMTHRNWIN